MLSRVKLILWFFFFNFDLEILFSWINFFFFSVNY
jgi:hypothetical protein